MKSKDHELYVQLIMKKLVLETQGEVSNKAYCDPFKMRVHLQGILGKDYLSEYYHNAIDYIERQQLARYGGMYITDKGVLYVEALMTCEHQDVSISTLRRKRVPA